MLRQIIREYKIPASPPAQFEQLDILFHWLEKLSDFLEQPSEMLSIEDIAEVNQLRHEQFAVCKRGLVSLSPEAFLKVFMSRSPKKMYSPQFLNFYLDVLDQNQLQALSLLVMRQQKALSSKPVALNIYNGIGSIIKSKMSDNELANKQLKELSAMVSNTMNSHALGNAAVTTYVAKLVTGNRHAGEKENPCAQRAFYLFQKSRDLKVKQVLAYTLLIYYHDQYESFTNFSQMAPAGELLSVFELEDVSRIIKKLPEKFQDQYRAISRLYFQQANLIRKITARIEAQIERCNADTCQASDIQALSNAIVEADKIKQHCGEKVYKNNIEMVVEYGLRALVQRSQALAEKTIQDTGSLGTQFSFMVAAMSPKYSLDAAGAARHHEQKKLEVNVNQFFVPVIDALVIIDQDQTLTNYLHDIRRHLQENVDFLYELCVNHQNPVIRAKLANKLLQHRLLLVEDQLSLMAEERKIKKLISFLEEAPETVCDLFEAEKDLRRRSIMAKAILSNSAILKKLLLPENSARIKTVIRGLSSKGYEAIFHNVPALEGKGRLLHEEACQFQVKLLEDENRDKNTNKDKGHRYYLYRGSLHGLSVDAKQPRLQNLCDVFRHWTVADYRFYRDVNSPAAQIITWSLLSRPALVNQLSPNDYPTTLDLSKLQPSQILLLDKRVRQHLLKQMGQYDAEQWQKISQLGRDRLLALSADFTREDAEALNHAGADMALLAMFANGHLYHEITYLITRYEKRKLACHLLRELNQGVWSKENGNEKLHDPSHYFMQSCIHALVIAGVYQPPEKDKDPAAYYDLADPELNLKNNQLVARDIVQYWTSENVVEEGLVNAAKALEAGFLKWRHGPIEGQRKLDEQRGYFCNASNDRALYFALTQPAIIDALIEKGCLEQGIGRAIHLSSETLLSIIQKLREKEKWTAVHKILESICDHLQMTQLISQNDVNAAMTLIDQALALKGPKPVTIEAVRAAIDSNNTGEHTVKYRLLGPLTFQYPVLRQAFLASTENYSSPWTFRRWLGHPIVAMGVAGGAIGLFGGLWPGFRSFLSAILPTSVVGAVTLGIAHTAHWGVIATGLSLATATIAASILSGVVIGLAAGTVVWGATKAVKWAYNRTRQAVGMEPERDPGFKEYHTLQGALNYYADKPEQFHHLFFQYNPAEELSEDSRKNQLNLAKMIQKIRDHSYPELKISKDLKKDFETIRDYNLWMVRKKTIPTGALLYYLAMIFGAAIGFGWGWGSLVNYEKLSKTILKNQKTPVMTGRRLSTTNIRSGLLPSSQNQEPQHLSDSPAPPTQELFPGEEDEKAAQPVNANSPNPFVAEAKRSAYDSADGEEPQFHQPKPHHSAYDRRRSVDENLNPPEKKEPTPAAQGRRRYSIFQDYSKNPFEEDAVAALQSEESERYTRGGYKQ